MGDVVENTTRAIGVSSAPGHVPVSGGNSGNTRGKMFSIGAPLESGLSKMSELQVSSCPGTSAFLAAGCSSGQSDGFGLHGHKAPLTCILLQDPLLMAHHGLNKPEVSLYCLLPLAMNHRNPLHRSCSDEREVYINSSHCTWKEKPTT